MLFLAVSALQEADDVLGVVSPADPHYLVELVDQPILLAVDKKLVARGRDGHLVLGVVSRVNREPGDPLRYAAEERLAAFHLRAAVGHLHVLRPSELERHAFELQEGTEAEVDADLGDRRLHGLDLPGYRQGYGAHRPEVSGRGCHTREGDGHVFGHESAVGVDRVGQNRAFKVEPHAYSPPS